MVWIIGNGAPKTGSTWVAELLNIFPGLAPVPDKFRNPGWKWPSVLDDLAAQAADELGPAPEVYFSKQHWAQETWLLKSPSIRVINSIRDIRDTIVSRYHHDMRVKQVPQMTISEYLAEHGRVRVFSFCNYHARWLDAPNMSADNYHVAAYEHLTADLPGAASDLADFRGIPSTPKCIEATANRTRFAEHKVKGPGEFFRKGQVGSFLDDLSPAEADQIVTWAKELGLLSIKRRLADLRPTIAPFLAQTDCGL